MIHRRTHPGLNVPGCFGCRIASVSVAPSATPTRHPQAAEVANREKRWNRDMSAYKSLRDSGVAPARIDGIADLSARATTEWEVRSGHLLPDMPGKEQRMRDANELCAEAGMVTL